MWVMTLRARIAFPNLSKRNTLKKPAVLDPTAKPIKPVTTNKKSNALASHESLQKNH
jgi:hypothetical protein